MNRITDNVIVFGDLHFDECIKCKKILFRVYYLFYLQMFFLSEACRIGFTVNMCGTYVYLVPWRMSFWLSTENNIKHDILNVDHLHVWQFR